MNIAKTVGIILLIIIVIFLLANYVFYDRYKMPKGAEILVKDEKIEVYDDKTTLYDLIKDSNVEFFTDNVKLDTSSIGEKTITMKYKYNGFKKYKFDVNYEVVDTTKPIFIKQPPAANSFYIDEASNEDLEKIKSKVSYADNYDIYPTLNVEGEVNFSELGTYKLKYIIKDSAGNENSVSSEITIKERPVITKDNNEKEPEPEPEEEEDNFTSFAEHIENNKKYNTMVGIDISKWQGEVDFEKVKEAGCEFVIMRIGVMKDKDSELVKDNTFDDNYKNAKAAGLKVGIYVYSEANNVDTAVSNAEFIINTLNGDKLDFPVAFDWESWSYFNSMEMNLHMLNEMYDAFSDKLKESGYETMLYASQNYLNNVWMDLKDYTLWVARYSSKDPEIENGNKCILWQNSSTGRIDGIEGDVDLDIFYK